MTNNEALDRELLELQPRIHQGDCGAIQKALKLSDRRIATLTESTIRDGVRRAFQAEIKSLVSVLKETLTPEEWAKVEAAIAQLEQQAESGDRN